ncbi:MAG: hypothetical protein JWM16_4044 [Verrucomicrobiales bacterium]|nr:hypothetical protein [Verrucomicrobiales bacterium]
MSTQQHRFLELRAQGASYNTIAVELRVSRRTLFNWKRELESELSWDEALEMESLREELLGAREVRARRLGKRLAAIEEELDKRSLADLSTARLFLLADGLHRQILKETTPPKPLPLPINDLATPVQPDSTLSTTDDQPSPSLAPKVLETQDLELNVPSVAQCKNGATTETNSEPSTKDTQPSPKLVPVEPAGTLKPQPSQASTDCGRFGRSSVKCSNSDENADDSPDSDRPSHRPPFPTAHKPCTVDAKPVGLESLRSDELTTFSGSLDVYLAKAKAAKQERKNAATPPRPSKFSTNLPQPPHPAQRLSEHPTSPSAPGCKNNAAEVQSASGPSTNDLHPAATLAPMELETRNLKHTNLGSGLSTPANVNPQPAKCLPISPERLIGTNINFREVLAQRRRASQHSQVL